MGKINVVKGDIFHLKRNIDWVIYRSANVDDMVFKRSVLGKSEYSITLPAIKLDESNAIEYLEYYKKAVLKAKEYKVKTIAIEAVDLFDDDLTLAFATEFGKLLEGLLSVGYMVVDIVCRTKKLRDIYEYGIFNEIISSLITMKDVIEDSEAIIIPVYRNILKFDENYECLKKSNPKKAFYKCYLNPRLEPGKFFLIEKLDHSGCYFFINMRQDKKQYKKMSKAEFYDLCLKAIKDVLMSVNVMKMKNITVPLLDYEEYKRKSLRNFMKKHKAQEINCQSTADENKKFITDIIDMCCKCAEETGLNVSFYCPSAYLWNFVIEYFGNKEKEDESK